MANFILIFFCGVTSFAQNDQKFTIKGAKSVDDLGYVSKRKAVDCNKELEWEESDELKFDVTEVCEDYGEYKSLYIRNITAEERLKNESR